jgi:hypothetical protein
MSVTIDTTDDNGENIEITLAKTGPDTGTIAVGGESYNLSGIKASADGTHLKCNVDGIIFFSPTVDFSVQGANSVRVAIAGAGPKSGTTNYPITPDTQVQITKFIKDSAFPALA